VYTSYRASLTTPNLIIITNLICYCIGCGTSSLNWPLLLPITSPFPLQNSSPLSFDGNHITADLTWSLTRCADAGAHKYCAERSLYISASFYLRVRHGINLELFVYVASPNIGEPPSWSMKESDWSRGGSWILACINMAHGEYLLILGPLHLLLHFLASLAELFRQ